MESKNKLPDISSDWLVFNEMTRVNRTAYIRGVSLVSQLAVVLFAGPSRLPATAVMEADSGVQGNCHMEESSDSEVGTKEVLVFLWVFLVIIKNGGLEDGKGVEANR